MSTQVISVGEYLELVNQTLKYIPSGALQVEGEVSDYRVAQGKWVSFDLKDEKTEAVLKCFMTTWQLKTPLEDGMRVRVKGYPKVYERFGTFKMNVQEVELVGEGALRRAYELLKKKLETEGLFEISRKRSLTRFPERIGLITSRDAAAYGDFIRILNNRWGGVHLFFVHVHVQGKEAVREIVEAFSFFQRLSTKQRPDVLVLTRGGGGLEDLHAFNDEAVARAIYASAIPVVCAVGHERDESLADFVADVRASTPSNAAERIVPSRQDVLYEIETLTRHMESRLSDVIQDQSYVIERATQLIGFILEQQKQCLLRATEGIVLVVQQWLMRLDTKREACERVLRQVDPKLVLSRGYSLVFFHGMIVKEAAQLEVGGEITVQFSASGADARVLRIDGKGQQKLM